ncbi:hypothetical protein N9Y26_01025 [bacterium]|nr:hypothetical protein [bacterium]
MDIIYNKDVIQGKNIGKNIHARVGILELNYKLKPKHTVRGEFQRGVSIRNNISLMVIYT